MGEVDEGKSSEKTLHSNVHGNASAEVKGLVQRLLYVFSNIGFGTRTAGHLDLTEVSVIPNADEQAREEARVVLECVVTEDMLNEDGKIHSACIAHFVDLCTTLPIAAMSFAKGGSGSAGLSQNINITYHAPASLGDKLRLINTATTIGAHAGSARIEIWNLTYHQLVASGTQVKMEPSSSWMSKL